MNNKDNNNSNIGWIILYSIIGIGAIAYNLNNVSSEVFISLGRLISGIAGFVIAFVVLKKKGLTKNIDKITDNNEESQTRLKGCFSVIAIVATGVIFTLSDKITYAVGIIAMIVLIVGLGILFYRNTTKK